MKGLWEFFGKCKFRLSPSKAHEILVWLGDPFGSVLCSQVFWQIFYELVLVFYSLLLYEFLKPLSHFLLVEWLGRSCLRLTRRDAHRLFLLVFLRLLLFVLLVPTPVLHIGGLLMAYGTLYGLCFECGTFRDLKLI